MCKYSEKTDKNTFLYFFLYIKMTSNYYQKHKEKLWKEACRRYQNLSEEGKEKKASVSLWMQ